MGIPKQIRFRPSEWCTHCQKRRAYDDHFRQNFPQVEHLAAHFYLMAIPYMEWFTRAKPGDWIIASLRSWGRVGYLDQHTVKGVIQRLVTEGLVEYIPGKCWGTDNTTRIRRRTMEEMDAIVSRRQAVKELEKESESKRERRAVYGKRKNEIPAEVISLPQDSEYVGQITNRLKDILGEVNAETNCGQTERDEQAPSDQEQG